MQLDDQLRAILSARLSVRARSLLSGASDCYNSFREGTPASDVAIGLRRYLLACWRERCSVLLTPDGVFLSLLHYVASSPSTSSSSTGLLTAAADAMPEWQIGLDQLLQEAPSLARTTFWTTNPGCQRAFACALLSRAQDVCTADSDADSTEAGDAVESSAAARATSSSSLSGGSVACVMVLGTRADWLQLSEVASRLLVNVADRAAVDRFLRATDCVQSILLRGGVVRAGETGSDRVDLCATAIAAPSIAAAADATGWLLDLAPPSRADVSLLPFLSRAGDAYLLVSALQGGRYCSEAVVRVPSRESFQRLICSRTDQRAPAHPTQDPGKCGDDCVDAAAALSALKGAIVVRDLLAALELLSHLPFGAGVCDSLQQLVLDDNWQLASVLADRLLLPPSTVAHDAPSASSKSAAAAVEDSLQLASQTGLVNEDFLSSIQSVSIDPVDVESPHSRKSKSVLSRASLLRLQRWALDEMLLQPDLDLSALVSLPAPPGSEFALTLST